MTPDTAGPATFLAAKPLIAPLIGRRLLITDLNCFLCWPPGTGNEELDEANATEARAAEFADSVKSLVSQWKDFVITSQTWFAPQAYDAVWLAALAAAQALPGEEGLGKRAIQAIRDGRLEPFSGATVRSWSWDSTQTRRSNPSSWK